MNRSVFALVALPEEVDIPQVQQVPATPAPRGLEHAWRAPLLSARKLPDAKVPGLLRTASRAASRGDAASRVDAVAGTTRTKVQRMLNRTQGSLEAATAGGGGTGKVGPGWDAAASGSEFRADAAEGSIQLVIDGQICQQDASGTWIDVVSGKPCRSGSEVTS